MPDMPADMVVEIPAVVDAQGLHRCQMQPMPEAIAALLRVQGSIHRLLVEAYAERSKEKLLQALLLDPTVDSYRRAVALMEDMLVRQRALLPELR
jgi:alpha-galactosidase